MGSLARHQVAEIITAGAFVVAVTLRALSLSAPLCVAVPMVLGPFSALASVVGFIIWRSAGFLSLSLISVPTVLWFWSIIID